MYLNLIIMLFLSINTFAETIVTNPGNNVIIDTFKKSEQKDGSQFSPELINELGSRALLTAKVMEISDDTLEIKENTAYFRLKNYNDLCRQIFINGLKYIIHTKCYRGEYVLLNFVSTFAK